MRHALIAALGITAAMHVTTAQTPTSTRPAAQTRLANAYRYRLLGVYDEQSGEPVDGVEVSDVMSGNKSLTTSTGTVSLLFLPEGASLIRLRKVGFGVQTMTVTISPADTAPITITLAKATTLPTVVVKDSARHWISPGLQGFEERRKLGFGHFIPDSILRKEDGRTLAHTLFAHLPGVVLSPGPAGSAAYYLATARECQSPNLRNPKPDPACTRPGCFVRIFQDGVMTYDGDPTKVVAMSIDLAHMTTSEWGAIEFYADGATAPVQYNSTGSDCGTLLLWTREK